MCIEHAMDLHLFFRNTTTVTMLKLLMMDNIGRFGYATRYDICEFLGLKPKFGDEHVGWDDIEIFEDLEPRPIFNGYIVALPQPRLVNKDMLTQKENHIETIIFDEFETKNEERIDI